MKPLYKTTLLSSALNKSLLNMGCLRGIAVYIMLFSASLGHTQDPVFSQFYLSPLQLNPGLTGLTDGPRLSANYRNQYPGFNNAYRTYALSYDQFFPSINSGAGLWLLSDDAGNGILKTIKAAGIFSYRLRLNKNLFLKMGTEIGIVQSTLNWDKLVFGDQIDEYLGTISPGGMPFPSEETAPEKNSIIYPDLGMGFVIYGGTLYGGISIRHLNTPNPDFLDINPSLSTGIPMRWTLHGGATLPVFPGSGRNSLDLAISPSFIFVRQGPFQQINGGVTFDTGPISFGGYYRLSSGNSDAIIGSIGLRTNQLRIGYSYDATISGFSDTGGTHEIGLVFVLGDGQKESRYSDCLELFR